MKSLVEITDVPVSVNAPVVPFETSGVVTLVDAATVSDDRSGALRVSIVPSVATMSATVTSPVRTSIVTMFTEEISVALRSNPLPNTLGLLGSIVISASLLSSPPSFSCPSPEAQK